MKRNVIPTMLGTILVTALSIGFTPAANAQSACSTAGAAGQWGYSYSGTIYLPSGQVLLAAVGRITEDQTGHFIGHQTRNVGGSSGEEVLRGVIRVNPDCSGTSVVRIYQGGKLQRTSYLNMVYVNGMKQAKWIFEALILPDKTNVPVVATLDMSRL
ncbi:MAG: hypothetical protein JO060_07640 [Candidatus Eremiobacteraeota bacterium]|nr:hypothetical protein [Candidatus Eremiobacteraeota bacterium]